jgi:hypothetical protein
MAVFPSASVAYDASSELEAPPALATRSSPARVAVRGNIRVVGFRSEKKLDTVCGWWLLRGCRR